MPNDEFQAPANSKAPATIGRPSRQPSHVSIKPAARKPLSIGRIVLVVLLLAACTACGMLAFQNSNLRQTAQKLSGEREMLDSQMANMAQIVDRCSTKLDDCATDMDTAQLWIGYALAPSRQFTEAAEALAKLAKAKEEANAALAALEQSLEKNVAASFKSRAGFRRYAKDVNKALKEREALRKARDAAAAKHAAAERNFEKMVEDQVWASQKQLVDANDARKTYLVSLRKSLAKP